MAKLNYQLEDRKASKKGNRFYTSRDMSELKRMISVSNAEANRGEHGKHTDIGECGCGMEGCFILRQRWPE